MHLKIETSIMSHLLIIQPKMDLCMAWFCLFGLVLSTSATAGQENVAPITTRAIVPRTIVQSIGSITKPGCQSKCGNLTVPYPFGIINGKGGSSCALNDWFEVSCNSSFNPPRPFMGDLHVYNISDSQGSRGIHTLSQAAKILMNVRIQAPIPVKRPALIHQEASIVLVLMGTMVMASKRDMVVLLKTLNSQSSRFLLAWDLASCL